MVTLYVLFTTFCLFYIYGNRFVSFIFMVTRVFLDLLSIVYCLFMVTFFVLCICMVTGVRFITLF